MKTQALWLLAAGAGLIFSSYKILSPVKRAVLPADEKKIDSLLRLMTLEEKIAMLHGSGMFYSAGVPRLGIPELTYADGPLGIREEVERASWASAKLKTDSATFFPNGSALAATWNPALAYRYGSTMGNEARARGKDIVLAPAINITRSPLNGRTFEYLSEDPYLNSRLAVAAVQGLQSQGVAACVKHFAVNNQETNRGKVNVLVDERAVREIYLPAFKAAVTEGGALTVMAAYNKMRGFYCSENDYLQNKVLRGEWGFNGFIMSDWGGTHSTVAAAKNGLDVEMGSSGPFESWYFARPLLDSVRAGRVDEKLIDEKVRRILRVALKTSMKKDRPAGVLASAGHLAAAYDIAAEAIVLLNNPRHILPIRQGAYPKIAVIGDNATRQFASGGFGAGVKAKQEATILQGLTAAIGKQAKISYSRGYVPSRITRGQAIVMTADKTLINEAAEAAKNADLAIVCIGANREYETEGTDRKDLLLPFGEQELADAVLNANPNTIIVVVAGAPYDLGALQDRGATLLWSWFNGSASGTALADVITGKLNPSGKMPFTFPRRLEDSPAHALDAFPGGDETTYKEGILVGYRWFDTKGTAPLYCFGYGLSYTSFTYSPITLGQHSYPANATITASIRIKNSGARAGKETVQFYVSDKNPGLPKAEKELKAFSKVSVAAGKETLVKVSIPVASLACYNEQRAKWVTEPGEYRLLAGASSRDIRQSVTFTVK